jgi:hypothetical protein
MSRSDRVRFDCPPHLPTSLMCLAGLDENAFAFVKRDVLSRLGRNDAKYM